MSEEVLATQFEAHRDRLRAVGFRMLGSAAEAEDAVQEAWLRLSRSDASSIENLSGWLTTVTSRVCLDMLRSRTTRNEVDFDEPLRDLPGSADPAPEDEALLSDSIGIAMMVVLDSLTPAERLAFVLHDMFGVPFDELAPIVGRSPTATRQLASRARRRVQGAGVAHADQPRRRQVVDAFLGTSRDGRFDDLLALLAPEARLRADTAAVAGARLGAAAGAPGLERELHGAHAVATAFSGRARAAQPALVDGMPGAVWAPGGVVRSVFVFVVEDDRVCSIEVVVEPDLVAALDVVLED